MAQAGYHTCINGHVILGTQT